MTVARLVQPLGTLYWIIFAIQQSVPTVLGNSVNGVVLALNNIVSEVELLRDSELYKSTFNIHNFTLTFATDQ